ncbi:MAG: hypothetical protein ACQEQU_08145 [Spirochaetota bacterium]
MLKKIVSSLLLCVIIGFPLAAQEAESQKEPVLTIERVEITVKGMSNKRLLRDRLDFDLDKTFESFEGLEEYVKARRQTLVNMRVFDEISYTIEEGSFESEYVVDFYIDDALTTLPIPYGKYDSNYGFKFGLKLFDTNLLGTLSDLKLTSFIAQKNNSWENKEYFNEMIWNDISLFGSTLDTKTKFQMNQDDQGFSGARFSTSILLKDLPLFSKNFSLSADLTAGQESAYDLSDWGIPTYNFNFSWKRLPFIENTITVGAGLKLEPDDEEAWIYTLSGNTTLHDLSLPFTEFDFSMGTSYSFSHRDFTDMNIPPTLNSIYFQISDSYRLPLDTTFSTSTRFTVDPRVSDLNPTLSFSNSLSRRKINWDHNYRKGLHFSLSNSLSYDLAYLFSGAPDPFPSYTKLSATGFAVLGDMINLGARLQAYYSSVDPYSFMKDSGTHPGEYMRGILDNNESLSDEARRYGGILNTNLTFTFLDFNGVAELLVSPFLDIGIFASNAQNELFETRFSGGVEGQWIFDKYKSYPFNVTLGANLKDVYSYMQGDIDRLLDIEYEILMTLELFY